MRFVIILSSILLTSCAAHMHPLKTHLDKDIQSIDLAKVEMRDIIHIRRFTVLNALLGSSALILDTASMVEHNYRYQQKAGPVVQDALAHFKTKLIQVLEHNGYAVHDSNSPYWDYFKPSKKALRYRSDAILHVHFEQQGFFSRGMRSDYKPSVFIVVELIDSKNRKILYHNQFATAIDKMYLEPLSMYFGPINLLENPKQVSHYKNVDDIIERYKQSRQDLLDVMALSAKYISSGLQRTSIPTEVTIKPKVYAITTQPSP